MAQVIPDCEWCGQKVPYNAEKDELIFKPYFCSARTETGYCEKPIHLCLDCQSKLFDQLKKTTDSSVVFRCNEHKILP